MIQLTGLLSEMIRYLINGMGIRMFPEPGLLLIDTTLFANITWRTVLPCSIDESFWNNGDGILEGLFFIINFREVPYIRMLEKYKDDDKVYRLL